MINSNKTKAMIIASRSKLNRINIDSKFTLNEKYILFVKHFSYLGVTLDNEMNLKSLLCDVKKRISNKIFLLRKLRRYITTDSALLIYKQTILPIFDYAGFMLLAVAVDDRKDLQIMQNDALRFCYNVRLNDHVSIFDLHTRAKLSSLEQRRIRQLLGLHFFINVIMRNMYDLFDYHRV